MPVFHVVPFSDIGVPALLAQADREGMRIFQSAVQSARRCGSAHFESNSVRHRVVRQDGAADIELGADAVVWRFDATKMDELLVLVAALIDCGTAGHHYVDDLRSPVETLVLSVDEYPGFGTTTAGGR